MNTPRTLAALALTLAYSGMVAAGCGEDKKECSVYQRGKLVSQSQCKISACATASGMQQDWRWNNGNRTRISMQGDQFLVNGQQGFGEATNGQSCYGVNKNRGEVYCLN